MNLNNAQTSLAEQLIVKILQYNMGLDANNIWIRDQDKLVPPDKGFYVVVGMVDSEPLSAVDTTIPTDDGMNEIWQIQTCDKIQIDIFSSDTQAIFRRWEVLAALGSVYAQQLQDANFFKIFNVPRSFMNTSDTEGGSRLNKFSIVISALVWYYIQKVITSPLGDYYDQFSTRVDDETTIGTANGIIEFNIPES